MELSAAHELHPWLRPRRDADALTGRSLRPLHRYDVISELGGGVMSTVHLAHDTATGRLVVVKRLAEPCSDGASTRSSAASRFTREANITAQLRHPNIVETIAVEREGGRPSAIVTSYVRGASLRDVLAAEGALPIDRVVSVLRDIAAALGYVHARRIVHCDVKPANILIEADTGRARLADFGIACESGAGPDVQDGLTVGTPAYMPPEQIEARPVDARADVYALCTVGWEMLAGRMPWLGEALADVLHRQRYASLPDLALLRPDVPVFLLRAINGGLGKDPETRWRDGAALVRQLSPTPTPLEVPRRGPVPLDATVQIDVRSAAAMSVAPHAPAPFAEPAEPPDMRWQRHVRVLVPPIAAIVLFALASLAPRLSRATEHHAVSVDPELDSMLTLAITPPSSRSALSANHAAPARRHLAGTRGRVHHRR